MLEIFSRYVPAKTLLLLITENLWITGTLVLLVELRARYYVEPDPDIVSAALRIALLTLLYQTCFFYNDLYNLWIVNTRRELIIRALQSFGAGAVVTGLLYLIFPDLMMGSGIVVVFVIVGILALLLWRTVVSAASAMVRESRRVLVLGTGSLATDLVRSILARPDLDIKVVGFVGDSPALVGQSLVNPKVVGTFEQLPELAESHAADQVVVALQDRRNRMPVRALLDLKLRGVDVIDAHSLYEKVTGKIRTTALPASWLVFSDGFRAMERKVHRKRVLDTLLAVAMGLPALPLAILVAIAVRMDSAGPVLFRQERVGRRGHHFHLLKFRTMRPDAEADGIPRWASDSDPRITRLGRWLRKTRLDEIPQIWNVLVGEMSFVGPRPERPFFVGQLREKLSYYDERHNVRPGVTGWAQVNYGYGATLEDALQKLQYDLFYIKNLSLPLDLAILFETGKIVLFGRGR